MRAKELGSLAPAPWSPAGGDPDEPANAEVTNARLQINAALIERRFNIFTLLFTPDQLNHSEPAWQPNHPEMFSMLRQLVNHFEVAFYEFNIRF